MNRAPEIVEAQLQMVLRQLKMPGVLRELSDVVRQMRGEGWTAEEFLLEVLTRELQSREDNTIKRRLHEACFPQIKTLEAFDYTVQPDVIRTRMMELGRCKWVEESRAVLLAGPVGTGKTHLGIGLGVAAAQRRYRVRFWRVADLVRQLTEAQGERELGKWMKRLEQVEVLILDELGFVPLERQGAELLFHVMADRYQKKATVVTSNLAFREWGKVFGDEKLAAAVLDRLGERAEVIATSGESYRMRRREKEQRMGTKDE